MPTATAVREPDTKAVPQQRRARARVLECIQEACDQAAKNLERAQRSVRDLERIKQGVEEGWMTPPQRIGPLEPFTPLEITTGKSSLELLLEDRRRR